MIVQQMPGAAHLLATNSVFNVAKPDGLTILAANPNVAIAQLSKVEQVRFDVRKFQWLGSSGADGVALSIRSDLPYKTFDELKKADRELVAGTTGPGSNAHDFRCSSRSSPASNSNSFPAIGPTAISARYRAQGSRGHGRRWPRR